MIKQISNSDTQAVSLTQRCFDELHQIYRPTGQAKKIKTSDKDLWTSFGYYTGGQLVGYAEVKTCDNELYLRSLAVEKQYRRQGIARELINQVVQKYDQVKVVSLWCVEQTGNVFIFKALGFNIFQKLESDLFELPDGTKATEVRLKNETVNILK